VTRNIVPDETAERNRANGLSGYTFNALVPVDYAGPALTFEAVRIGDHAHVHVSSGRAVPHPWPKDRITRGFAGKLVLAWPDWLLLREILDTDPRARIAEVEYPSPGVARRYAADGPEKLSPGGVDKLPPR
jgi:hypothetical protein